MICSILIAVFVFLLSDYFSPTQSLKNDEKIENQLSYDNQSKNFETLLKTTTHQIHQSNDPQSSFWENNLNSNSTLKNSVFEPFEPYSTFPNHFSCSSNHTLSTQNLTNIQQYDSDYHNSNTTDFTPLEFEIRTDHLLLSSNTNRADRAPLVQQLLSSKPIPQSLSFEWRLSNANRFLNINLHSNSDTSLTYSAQTAVEAIVLTLHSNGDLYGRITNQNDSFYLIKTFPNDRICVESFKLPNSSIINDVNSTDHFSAPFIVSGNLFKQIDENGEGRIPLLNNTSDEDVNFHWSKIDSGASIDSVAVLRRLRHALKTNIDAHVPSLRKTLKRQVYKVTDFQKPYLVPVGRRNGYTVFPNCYKEQARGLELFVGLVADRGYVSLFEDENVTKMMMKDLLSKASHIFEMQLHIRFLVHDDDVLIASGHEEWNLDSQMGLESDDWPEKQLTDFVHFIEKLIKDPASRHQRVAFWILFTDAWDVEPLTSTTKREYHIGVARTFSDGGSLCSPHSALLISHFVSSDYPEKDTTKLNSHLLTHSIGQLFGAKIPFGLTRVGASFANQELGVMSPSYYFAKYQEILQFAPRYNAKTMCNFIQNKLTQMGNDVNQPAGKTGCFSYIQSNNEVSAATLELYEPKTSILQRVVTNLSNRIQNLADRKIHVERRLKKFSSNDIISKDEWKDREAYKPQNSNNGFFRQKATDVKYVRKFDRQGQLLAKTKQQNLPKVQWTGEFGYLKYQEGK